MAPGTSDRITAYLKSGGTLEKAAAMANHASTRTTQLYGGGTVGISLTKSHYHRGPVARRSDNFCR